jgi:hypothetical protein
LWWPLLHNTGCVFTRLFITGGNRGLGREMALAITEAGTDVVLVGRDSVSLEETAADVRALGRQAWPMRADAAVPEECERVCREALSLGPIDILINNIGGRGASIRASYLSIPVVVVARPIASAEWVRSTPRAAEWSAELMAGGNGCHFRLGFTSSYRISDSTRPIPQAWVLAARARLDDQAVSPDPDIRRPDPAKP